MANQNNQVTIGSLATEMLKQGIDKKEILVKLKRVFPESQTSMKCLYYYASQAGITTRKSKVVDNKELEKLLKELDGEKTAPKKPRAKRQKKVKTPKVVETTGQEVTSEASV